MKKLIPMVILFSSMAIAQVNNPGTSFPDPGSAGLCWVSTGATTYAWGSCSGAASAAFSAITGSTNTTAAMVIGTGASLATAGSGTIAATTSAKWAVARTLAGNSVDGSANVAFPNKFLVQGTADAGLSGAQFMGALGTGIVKNTTTTGVLSIAIAGDFPTLNQSTTGSAATLTTPRAIYGNNFDGSAALSQIIASTFGGTGNGFTKFSGPLTAEKTFTLPNASAVVLTDAAAVTGAQGGLNANASAFTGVLREASGTASASELSGAVTTSASNVTAMGKIDVTDANVFCAAAGANTTTYTCSLSPAISGYVTGTHYRFKADVANTAASTINFNAQGAKTIKKAVGGITTDLVANDLRAGQWVDMVYDGTNMQMQSTLGNAASGSGTVNAATQYSFPYYSASGSASTLDGVAGPTANGFYTVGYNVTGGVALAPTAVLSGVPVNAQVGTSYTVLYSDRNSYLSFTNAASIAVTLPQAGTTGFGSNFAFDACAIGAGTVTITPTTSTISYSTGTAYSAAQATLALTTGQCAFIYSDNTNYFAFQIKGGGAGSGTVNSGTAGHLAYYASSTTAVSDSKVTVTVPATGSTLTILDGKTLTANNSITLAGTDTTTMTFPTTSATIARTDAANTFAGHQTVEGVTSTGATGTGKFVFDTSPVLTTPRATTLNDANGNPFIASSATASAVDSVTITNAATANPATVTVGATGSDSNINLSLVPKGTGNVLVCPACTNAGFYQFGQGTTNSLGTTAVTIQAPTSVTSYSITLPGAAANGIPRWANSANVVTESVSELSGDAQTSGSNAVTVTRINNVGVQRVVMTADWTCGTGGVSSSCTAATIVGTGGTPLTITLPSVTASYHWQCDGVVGQATAATANSWNVITATNAPTNLEATYQMNTAATAMTGGAITGVSATTTTVIAPTWTLGGTATKMPFHVQGSIEGASASGTVISLQLVAPTVADLVTVYRGTSCSVAPF